jgi:hypothetical protein
MKRVAGFESSRGLHRALCVLPLVFFGLRPQGIAVSAKLHIEKIFSPRVTGAGRLRRFLAKLALLSRSNAATSISYARTLRLRNFDFSPFYEGAMCVSSFDFFGLRHVGRPVL